MPNLWEDKLPTFVVGYYEENPAVAEAITVMAENESVALKNAKKKLNAKGLKGYEITCIKTTRLLDDLNDCDPSIEKSYGIKVTFFKYSKKNTVQWLILAAVAFAVVSTLVGLLSTICSL